MWFVIVFGGVGNVFFGRSVCGMFAGRYCSFFGCGVVFVVVVLWWWFCDDVFLAFCWCFRGDVGVGVGVFLLLVMVFFGVVLVLVFWWQCFLGWCFSAFVVVFAVMLCCGYLDQNCRHGGGVFVMLWW